GRSPTFVLTSNAASSPAMLMSGRSNTVRARITVPPTRSIGGSRSISGRLADSPPAVSTGCRGDRLAAQPREGAHHWSGPARVDQHVVTGQNPKHAPVAQLDRASDF